jgi:hypothetical protein
MERRGVDRRRWVITSCALVCAGLLSAFRDSGDADD